MIEGSWIEGPAANCDPWTMHAAKTAMGTLNLKQTGH